MQRFSITSLQWQWAEPGIDHLLRSGSMPRSLCVCKQILKKGSDLGSAGVGAKLSGRVKASVQTRSSSFGSSHSSKKLPKKHRNKQTKKINHPSFLLSFFPQAVVPSSSRTRWIPFPGTPRTPGIPWVVPARSRTLPCRDWLSSR